MAKESGIDKTGQNWGLASEKFSVKTPDFEPTFT
jgi:hypothetical protein